MRELLDLEVVIVGGGIMGLWLANDLHAGGYRFALLERNELGGEQTCHSHVYIHQGHIYREDQARLAGKLKSVTSKWQAWLQNRSMLKQSDHSCFGFRDQVDFTAKRTFWEKPNLGLAYRDIPKAEWPDALRAGVSRASGVKILVSTPEQCLDGNLVVRELQKPAVRHRTFLVSGIDWVRINREEIEIVARTPRSGAIRMRSRFLVFAAGAGNVALMGEVFPESLAGKPSPQQIRKAHMLVARGACEDLPPLNGVFRAFDGLFLVSRKLGAENVWIVSDHRNEAINHSEDWGKYDRKWWLPRVIENLRDLSPAVLDRADRLAWGVYEAPKAEGYADGGLPEEDCVLPLSDNAFAVWPTKLTLAPKASEALMARMNLRDRCNPEPEPDPADCEEFERPEVAKERWALTPMKDWDTFRRNLEHWKGD